MSPTPVHVEIDPWRGAFHILCALSFAAVACLLAVHLCRGVSRIRNANDEDQGWTKLALGGFALALLVRLAVPAQLSNWYAAILPATGDAPWERFGPGTFVFQSLLRAILPWTDTTLFVSNALLGAALFLPYAGFLRELKLNVWDAGAAIVLLALFPAHVQISASASEHVLSSTLTVLALWAWLRGFAKRDVVLQILALACLPAAAFVRGDAWPQLALVALWPVLAYPPSLPWAHRRIVRWTAVFAVVWLATGAALLPTLQNHPLPRAFNFLGAVLGLFPQFFVYAFQPPFWMPPLMLALALVGAVGLYRTDRRLLAGVVASLFLIFVPIGRGLGIHIIEARYFLVSFCIVGVLSAVGFGKVRRLLDQRLRTRWSSAPVLLGLLAAITATSALPALTTRYAFQDEYTFLRGSLQALPDGCLVFSIPARDTRIERDVDAGLALPSSPLTIVYPRLIFRELRDGLPEVRGDQCVAYYESALCSIEETLAVKRRLPEAYDVIRGRCEEVRSSGSFDLIAEAEVSPLALTDVFGGHSPTVRLSRWHLRGR